MKKKFEVTIVRESKVIVELDDEHFNDKYNTEFERVFYPVEGLESHAEYVALGVFRGDEFIEGYGNVPVDGYTSYSAKNINEHVSVTTDYDETTVDYIEEIN